MSKSNINLCFITKLFFGLLAASSLALPLAAGAADLSTARDLLNQHKYPEAAVEANRYLADHPGDTQARFIRGLALARSGKVDAAINLFQQLAEDYPDLAEPRNNLGVLYAQQEKFLKARDALEKAVEINPNHGPAQENLGDVYVALARNAYSKASQLEQDNVAVRTKRKRLQALLDAPRAQAYVQNAPAKTVEQAPETLAGNEQAAPAQPRAAAPSVERPESNAREGGENAQIRSAANAWAHAWAAQDYSAYINAYSDDFTPASGQSRSAWASERRQRVTSPGTIEVQLSDFDYKTLDDGRVIVSFNQRYRSDNYRDRERKALLMREEGGTWKILREDTPSAVRAYSQRGTNAGSSPEVLAPKSSSGSADTSGPRALVDSWAQAWSNQNLNAYFAAYSDNFNPGNGQSLSSWIRERKERISKPNNIQVGVSNLNIQSTGPDSANVHFTQSYRSGRYHDRVRKTLELRHTENGWRIVREISD